MKTVILVLRRLCLVAGICGALASAWVFVDPGAFPQMLRMDGPLAPPSPRWRTVLGFLFSLLLIGYGSGHVRHRELP